MIRFSEGERYYKPEPEVNASLQARVDRQASSAPGSAAMNLPNMSGRRELARLVGQTGGEDHKARSRSGRTIP